MTKRQELIDALKLVILGVGEGNLGGPKLVIFDKGWIRSLNENLSVSHKFEIDIEGGLPIEELFKVLNKMEGDDFTVTSDEQKVVFKCGKTRLKLLKAIGDDFTKLKQKMESLNLDNIIWAPIPTRLLEGLQLSLFSADNNEIGRLSGVVISGDTILSSDNYRISMYEMGQEIATNKIIRIKTSSVSNLVKMKNTFELISFSDEWFHLKSKDTLILSIRLLPLTNYPLNDVLSVFDQIGLSEDTVVYELPGDLEGSLDRAQILAGIGVGELNYAPQISLKSEDGNLLVIGKKSVGELVDTILWEGKLPHVTMNPIFLKKVVAITRKFKIIPNKNMVLFETPNFRFLSVATEEKKNQEDK